MTKKIKKTMILSFISLFGLMAALFIGTILPCSSPVRADETGLSSNAIFSLDFDDQDEKQYIFGHSYCNDYNCLTFEESKAVITYKSGAVRHYFIRMPFSIISDTTPLDSKFIIEFDLQAYKQGSSENILNTINKYDFCFQLYLAGNKETESGFVYEDYAYFGASNGGRILFQDIATKTANRYSVAVDYKELCESGKSNLEESFIPSYNAFIFAFYVSDSSDITINLDNFRVYNSNTLTFKDGDNVVKTYTCKQGSQLLLVNVASDWTRSGYKIIGISETPDGKITAIAFDTAITVTADKTYYVRYQKIPETRKISIYVPGIAEPRTVNVPEKIDFKLKDYVSIHLVEKDGYTLVGFSLEENGAKTYDYNDSVLNLSSDITLYALYSKNLTVKIIADGRVKITATAEKGKTMDLGGAGITSIMTKEGYTLKGYATAEDGETVYEADAVITPESDMTLYAVYEEIKAPNDDETDKTGEQDKQDKKTVNVTGILVSIPLLALLAAGTVYLVGKIKKS